MREEKKFIHQWLNTGTKKALLIKCILAGAFAIYFTYQLGYGLGTFLAHIGL